MTALRRGRLTLALLALLAPALAGATDAAKTTVPRAATAAGFVDVRLGFQRLPAAGANYTDGDVDVSGGADPRWDPQQSAHMRAAAVQAAATPGSVRTATRLPFLLSLRGDLVGAESALAKAKQRFPDSVGVYWSEGWIRLNLRDPEGALVAWQQAERLHGGQPYWVPYSKAIALLAMNDQAAATQWWQLAQRGHAPELDTPAAACAKFVYWRDNEKSLLERLIPLAYPGAPVGADGYHCPVTRLKLITQLSPKYPLDALRKGLQGRVLVRMRVPASGVPEDLAVAQSSGNDQMDAAAIEAARQARFSVDRDPGALDRPIDTALPIVFALSPNAANRLSDAPPGG